MTTSAPLRLRRAAVAAVLAVTGVLVPVAAATPAAAADLVGVALSGPLTETSRLGTQALGGGAGASTCPEGSVLTGLDARGTTHPSGNWLSSASARCTALVLSGADARLGAPVASAGALVGTLQSATTYTADCPDGSIATGLQGFGGALVDQVTLLCSPLTADGALGAATPSSPAGVVGGGPQGPFSCPSGTVGVALAGRVGQDLDQLGLSCQALLVASTAPDEVNTSWATALRVAPTSTTTSTVRLSGQDRWFKFAVTPGSRVQVGLTGLPADYDLTLFKDVQVAFDTWTAEELSGTEDLHRLSAEFAADAFAPSVFSPSVFSPSVFSPSVFSPSVFSPSVFSPSVFSPSVFSPSVFSPSVFSEAFSSAQTRSLIAVSANDGTAPESIDTATWNNTGDFYVRVQGRNGAASPLPFTLQVTTTGGICDVALNDFSGLATTRGAAGPTAVILGDLARTGDPSGALAAALRDLAAQVGGVVVDLSEDARVTALNAQADGITACPYAKNLVAEGIRDIVNSYRGPALKHVVVVGDDSDIPFFRYPDGAGLGPESGYVPPVADPTASQASLRNDFVLSQDAYGAQTDISVKGTVLPVPDLAVGRLVETPAEITKTVRDFLARNGAPLQPRTTLTTGYDFLTDAADAVAAQFAAGVPGGRHDTLITDQDVPPTVTTPVGGPSRRASWTADDLRTALVGGAKHDVAFLAGHFSANSALAADYSTSVLTTELAQAPAGHFADTLVFSAGCHSGYNIVDGEGVPGVTVGLDWTQALVSKGATLIAGTGYQYGDTDFLDYSERLYASFARELRTGTGPSVAVGSALVEAKRDYLATTPTMRGIDTKAVLQATLYGLPMLGVDLPGRVQPPTPTSSVADQPVAAGTPGAELGLTSAELAVGAPLTEVTKPLTSTEGGTVTASWLTGPDGVDSNPAEPAVPLVRRDVTVAGKALRGVGLRSGTYTDTDGITPLTGAPATESSSAHTPFVSPAFFPSRLATVNAFDALGGGGATGRTTLAVTPAQHRSDAAGSLTDTRRRFDQVGLQLFYSGNTSSYAVTGGGESGEGVRNVPALAAPPSIGDVSATGGEVVGFRARVAGDPSAGVQQVWVTYTGERGSPFHGRWTSLDLVQDPQDSTLWTGSLPLPAGQRSSDVRYLVQAVNGVGLVTLDDARGRYHAPGQTPGEPLVVLAPTSLALAAPPPTADHGTSVPVAATLTGGSGALAGRPVTFGLAGSARTALTGADGVARTSLPVTALPGSRTLTAVFAGGADLAASAAAPSSVEVRKQATALALTSDGSSGVVATLTAGGLPLRDRTVLVVSRDSADAVVAVTPVPTGPLGVARAEAKRLPVTARSHQAYFAGTVPLPQGSVTLADPGYAASTSARSTTAARAVAPELAPAVLGAAYAAEVATGWDLPLTAAGLPPGTALTGSGGTYVLSGTPTRAGVFSVVLSSGSTVVARRTFVVRYVVTPFAQPVDDPAGAVPSTFNVRSTVPVKLALTDAKGVRIPDAEAQALVAACRVQVSLPLTGSTPGQVSEPIVNGAGDSGTCMRYDATADQLVHNATRANLGFVAGRSYTLTVTVRAATGEVLGLREVAIGFR